MAIGLIAVARLVAERLVFAVEPKGKKENNNDNIGRKGKKDVI